MSNNQNPFRHHHEHDHGHDHDHEHEHEHGPNDGPGNELDPAQQSLADALRFSFTILKWVMIVLLVFYGFSGVFNVPAGYVAMRLTFGKVQGLGESRVLQPGNLHFSLPYPINEVVQVPTSVNSIDLKKEFWYVSYDSTKSDDQVAPPAGPLDPTAVGSLLTGDRNIIHARFRLQWVISDPIKYVENVGEKTLAETLVRAAAEEGIIYAAATAEADAVLKGQFKVGRAVTEAQRILNEQDTGITLVPDFFLVDKTTMPGSVEKIYREVGVAESERAQEIEKARQEYTKVMVETAGEAHQALWELIKKYQTASAAGDAQALAEMDAQLDDIFKKLEIPVGKVPTVVTGRVAELINDANNYRSAIAAQMQAEANTFDNLYEKYKADPALRRILRESIWQSAREEIMTGDVETFYLTAGQAYLDMNRDPKVSKKRSEQQLKAAAGTR